MRLKDLPSISVVMPTLNASRTLRESLSSIQKQNYPKRIIEIIIADGGSTDNTLEIAKNFCARIIENPLKTSEAGKAIGIKNAKNELILLIDSDNILPRPDWLLKMTKPFRDPEITGSEPLRYDTRKKDGLINQYCSLIGANDPLCMFLGNYDRFNYLTGKWTEVKLIQKKKDKYFKVAALGDGFPTIGANGFLVRKGIVKKYAKEDYFFDIDATYDLATNQHKSFAKVDVGIYHLYAPNLKTFYRKQTRRVLDFLHFKDKNKGNNKRIYPWADKKSLSKILKFCLYSSLVFPTCLQAIKGYSRKPNSAWFFHPIACFITLFIYATRSLEMLLFHKTGMMNRENW